MADFKVVISVTNTLQMCYVSSEISLCPAQIYITFYKILIFFSDILTYITIPGLFLI